MHPPRRQVRASFVLLAFLVKDDEAAHRWFTADFVDPAQWRVFPDVFPALDGLSSRGWTHLVLSNHVPELSSIAGGPGLGERVLRVFNSAETGYEKPHPEAYRRVLRTLGGEVEAVRRVIRTGREEVGVPELCFSHGDQEKSAEAVTTESRPVSPCRSQEKPWRKT